MRKSGMFAPPVPARISETARFAPLLPVPGQVQPAHGAAAVWPSEGAPLRAGATWPTTPTTAPLYGKKMQGASQKSAATVGKCREIP